MAVFNMPSLGADMEAGTLVEWLVKPGDAVKHGDIVAVVETQKGAIEIEVFETGIVDRLVAEVGQKVPVGAPLAEIRSSDTVGSGETKPTTAPAPAPKPEAQPKAAVSVPVASGIAGSPAARARAAELGIDLAEIKGSGPGGAVVLADVEARSTPRKAEVTTEDRGAMIAEMRKAIGAAMARSKREIPHYYVSHTVDLAAANDWLAGANTGKPPEERLLMGALLVRAVALAAREVQPMNGHHGEGGFVPAEAVHLGLAVSLRGGGLVAPAIMNADSLGLNDLMKAMRDVTARARAGRLKSSEMSMATLTFSGLGETGVEAMTGVIVPPQVAIVTAGAPQTMALVRDGQVVAVPAVTLTLAADHRVSDGRLGSKYLMAVDRILQEPEAL